MNEVRSVENSSMLQSSRQEPGMDLNLEVGGQKVSVKNVKSFNTIVTVLTLFATCSLGTALYFHEASAQQEKGKVAETLKESNSNIAAILKENNAAQKEQTKAMIEAIGRLERKTAEVACLSDPAIKNRTDARAFCRAMSRDDR